MAHVALRYHWILRPRSLAMHVISLMIILIFAQVFISCTADEDTKKHEILKKLGEIALCPFIIEWDYDPNRIPANLTEHKCVKGKQLPNVTRRRKRGFGNKLSETCESIQGTCYQITADIDVEHNYRNRKRLINRMTIKIGCVCAPNYNSSSANQVRPTHDIS